MQLTLDHGRILKNLDFFSNFLYIKKVIGLVITTIFDIIWPHSLYNYIITVAQEWRSHAQGYGNGYSDSATERNTRKQLNPTITDFNRGQEVTWIHIRNSFNSYFRLHLTIKYKTSAFWKSWAILIRLH